MVTVKVWVTVKVSTAVTVLVTVKVSIAVTVLVDGNRARPLKRLRA